MEILSQRWYEALLKRRSRRLYEARLIPTEVFEKLTAACNEFRPLDTAGAVFTECSKIDSCGISKRFDCGIAMLHIETAARVFEVAGKWEFPDPPEVARFMGHS